MTNLHLLESTKKKGDGVSSGSTKQCIACAEDIQAAALLCRHCSTDQRDQRFLTEFTSDTKSDEFDNVNRNLNGSQVESTELLLPNAANSVATGDVSEGANLSDSLVNITCRICGQKNHPGATDCVNCEWSLGKDGVIDFSGIPKSTGEHGRSEASATLFDDRSQNTNQSSKSLLVWVTVATIGVLAFFFSLAPTEFTPNQNASSERNLSSLSSEQELRVNKFLNQFGRDDEILNAVAKCVSRFYDNLSMTLQDPSERGVPLARVMDCVEASGVGATCGQADNGSGPICGPAGARSGYSIVSVFGTMAGMN